MDYIIQSPITVWELLLEHLQITSVSILIAIALALPLALLVTSVRWLAVPILGILGVFYTIPSLALIILLVPIFGLSAQSVIAAMVIYTQVILVRNLAVAINSLDPSTIEAAKGMGMNRWQRWWWVQLPLVLPAFLAGVRLATIVTVAIASIGAKFGAGGLGVLLFEGIQQNRTDKIWAGTIALAILAFTLNSVLLYFEQLSRRQSKVY